MATSKFIARSQLNDLPWDLTRDGARMSLVASSLAARRTVRIQYSRGCDTYYVYLARGDEVVRDLVCVSAGESAEELAEVAAAAAAECYGVDVSRLDTP